MATQLFQKSRSIISALTTGYVVMIVLFFVGFLTAYSAQRDARAQLDDFRARQLPEAVAARALSAGVQLLESGLERLSRSAGENELREVERALFSLHERIGSEIRSMGSRRSALIELSEQIGYKIRLATRLQSVYLTEQGRISAQIDDLMREIEALELLAFRAALSDMESNTPAWQEIQRLTTGAKALLMSLPLSTSEQKLLLDRNQLVNDLHSAVLKMARSGQTVSNERAARMLSALSTSLLSDDGAFLRHLRSLAVQSKAASLVSEAISQAHQLLIEVNEASAAVTAEAAVVLETSYDALRTSETILLVVQALALLVGMFFVWRVIERGVGARLRALAERTQRYAQAEYQLDEQPTPRGPDYEEFQMIEGALGVFADNARELRDTRQALEEVNEQLQVSMTELEHFTYAASHDLRSPLRAIGTLARFAQEDLAAEDSDAVVEHLKQIEFRADHLNRLTLALLDFAERGSRAYPNECVDLEALLDEIDGLQHDDSCQLLRKLDCTSAMAPRPVLHQVLSNLIDNAVKHRQRSAPVRVQVSMERSEDGLRISVDDDGPGISPEHRGRVTEAFVTLEPKSKTGFTGLGLSMVARLVAGMGGSMNLEDSALGGLRVVLSLPQADAALLTVA